MSSFFFEHDIKQTHDALVSKEISVEELTKNTLEFTKETDKELNAFITLNEDAAISRAKELDAKGIEADNLLYGIPMGLKDLILTNGIKTTAGSKILGEFVPVYDATVASKLKDSSTILIGKNNLDEFAMGGSNETSFFGSVKNPWNKTKVPGGSSGGSAASVAGGQIPFSLGSDTGGSIRQPASYTGLVGMKPTYGRVSRWGIVAFSSSLDQVGPLTRTVKDNAIVLNAISGFDEHDATSSQNEVPDFTKNLGQEIKGLKIAVPKEFFMDGISEEVKETVRAGIKQLEALGAQISEVSLPLTKYGIAAYYILASSEASSNLQRFDGIRYGFSDRSGKTLEDVYEKTKTEGFGFEVKRRIMLGTFALSAGFYDAYFKKAAQVRTRIIQDFNKVFEDYDVIVGPTAPTTAFGIGEENNDPKTMYLNDVLTIPVSMAGLPGVSVPAGFSKDGLPIGMQIIGKHFDEQTIYKTAYAFEQSTRLFEKRPDLENGGGN